MFYRSLYQYGKTNSWNQLDIVAVTDGVPCRLGDNDPRDPRLTPYPVNVIEGLKLIYVYELHEYTM